MTTTEPKRVGIAIDAWKLELFTRHLTDAGCDFEQGPGVTPGTLMLIVVTTDPGRLGQVVRFANEAAAKEKRWAILGRS